MKRIKRVMLYGVFTFSLALVLVDEVCWINMLGLIGCVVSGFGLAELGVGANESNEA